MMDLGHFYYISDQYFQDFSDPYLMQNKEAINGHIHDRLCFYSFQDKITGLYWMIPFSSQINKFQKIYNDKINKYGRCDTIVLGEVLGYRKAFLIQNMCPITSKYVKNEYLDSKTQTPVRIDWELENRLNKSAARVLTLQRQGKRLIFPNVLEIEKQLLQRIN